MKYSSALSTCRQPGVICAIYFLIMSLFYDYYYYYHLCLAAYNEIGQHCSERVKIQNSNHTAVHVQCDCHSLAFVLN